MSTTSPYIAVAHDSGDRFALLDHGTPGTLSALSSFDAETNLAAVAVHPEGEYLALLPMFASKVMLLARENGTLTLSHEFTAMGGWDGVACAFSPDGQYLATFDEADIRLFSINESGELVLEDTEADFWAGWDIFNPGALAWSPGGAYLAVADTLGGRGLTVFSVAGGTLSQVAQVSPQDDGVTSNDICYGVAWHDQWIAVSHQQGGSLVSGGSSLTLFRFDHGNESLTEVQAVDAQYGNCRAVAFTPDGSHLVAMASDNTARLLAFDQGAEELTEVDDLTIPDATGTPRHCAFDHSGQYLAVPHPGSPFFTLLERDGNALSASDTHTLDGQGRSVGFVMQQVATAFRDGGPAAWDWTTETPSVSPVGTPPAWDWQPIGTQMIWLCHANTDGAKVSRGLTGDDLRFGQTFTVDARITVEGFQIMMTRGFTINGDPQVFFELWNLDPNTGFPTGTPIATIQQAGNSMPINSESTPPINCNLFAASSTTGNVLIFGSPVTLEPGQYAWTVRRESSGGFQTSLLLWGDSHNDVYLFDGGVAIVSFNGGASWLTYEQQWGWKRDQFFRMRVRVPEPSLHSTHGGPGQWDWN